MQTNKHIFLAAWTAFSNKPTKILNMREYWNTANIGGKFRCVLPRPNGLFRKKSRQPSNQQTLWPKFAQKKALFPYIFLGLWSREIKRGGEGIFPLSLFAGKWVVVGREIDGIVLLFRRGGKSLPLQYKGFFLEKGGKSRNFVLYPSPQFPQSVQFKPQRCGCFAWDSFSGEISKFLWYDFSVGQYSTTSFPLIFCEKKLRKRTVVCYSSLIQAYIRLLYSLKMQTTLSNPAKMLSTFRRKKSPEPFAF